MPFQYKTLFQDPTPDGYVNLRLVLHMMNIAQTYTDFTDAEFHEFVKHLLLIAKKMVATWRHLARYEEVEVVHGKDGPSLCVVMSISS